MPSQQPAAKTVYLMDASAFIHRSFHALRRLSNRRGQPTGAAYGFTNSLLKLLKDKDPQYLGIVYDCPGTNRRKAIYAAYKANRPPTDPDLASQFAPIRRIVDALGFASTEESGFEADDVIASYARRFAAEGADVVVLSADKDFYQLLSERVSMYDPSPDKLSALTLESFREKYEGLEPPQFLECQALMGDNSDNIPGVAGIGEKTALKLVRDFGNLDRLYAEMDASTLKYLTPLLKGKLKAHEDDARLSRRLAALGEGCRAELPLESFAIAARDSDELRDAFELLDFRRLLSALGPDPRAGLPRKAGKDAPSPPAASAAGPAAAPGKAPPAVDYSAYALVASEDGWKELEGELARAPKIAVDVETDSVMSGLCSIVGISLATGTNRAFYVPVGHRPEIAKGANQDLGGSLARLAPFLLDPSKSLCAQNAKFDWRILARFGLKLPAPSSDPMLAAYLLNPDDHKSLDALSLRYLDHNPRSFAETIEGARAAAAGADAAADGRAEGGYAAEGPAPGEEAAPDGEAENEEGDGAPSGLGLDLGPAPGGGLKGGKGADGGKKGKPKKKSPKRAFTFADVGLRSACEYSAEDADLALRVAPAAEADLASDPALLNLYSKVELPLETLLVSMELAGLKADPERLAAISLNLGSDLDGLEARIWDEAGFSFNVGSPSQVADVLFNKLGLPSGRRTNKKTSLSTDSAVLKDLAPLHPVAELILQHRETAKLKSTYADRLPLAINPLTGRIHTTFHQTSTLTGRLSSSDPNLQNIPTASGDGRDIRGCFTAEEGKVLVSCDYSQIELRVMAELSGDLALTEAFRRGEDIHRETAAAVFGKLPEAVTPEERSRAKSINFGIIYGQGAFGLGQAMKIPQGAARDFIERYFARFPGINSYMERVKKDAARSGEVRTLFGRRRYLTGFKSASQRERAEAERFAINTPVQGSAADLIKIAMLRAARRLAAECPSALLVLQIHDELLCEVPEADAERATRVISEEMVAAGSEPFFPGAPVMKVPLKVDHSAARSWTHA
ncbi:MAG: DNA polymerase I [Deltaproteobacteria bacterium]|jgi:DNA polymerase-1|nr:DNA polymerase I [Deltaproteobacteria bacterium]